MWWNTNGKSALSAAVLLLFAASGAAAEQWPDTLTVHEWGTFTTLQDEQGRELTGINVDDEPVPQFVHNLSPYLLARPILSSLHWQYRQKASPRRHPLVTMRLETPVIYFYPPADAALPMRLDVAVHFRGGWLTEFFPHAAASAPGLKSGMFEFGELAPDTVGSLTWQNVAVGTGDRGPDTNEHVWLAPRRTQSAPLTVDKESEKYLFYRGIGGQRAPLRVITNRKWNELSLCGNFDEVLEDDESATIPQLWLVHVRDDGTAAFQTLNSLTVTAQNEGVLAVVPADFKDSAFTQNNLRRLKEEMHRELVAAGLYDDEAAAMLATWDRAYFQSPGLRLFFIVPRQWTDHYLPLSITHLGAPVEADVERVMMARIELISPQQRTILDRLAKTAISDGKWVQTIPESPAREAFLAGRSNFGDLGVAIPPDYQMYLALGRFRNALVVGEERARPTPSLTQFINTYQLHPYRWPSAEGQALAEKSLR